MSTLKVNPAAAVAEVGMRVRAMPCSGEVYEGPIVSVSDRGVFIQDEGGQVIGALWEDTFLVPAQAIALADAEAAPTLGHPLSMN